MKQPNNQKYYVARAATSRDFAGRAASPGIAAIHAELASRYDRLASLPEQSADGALTVSQPK